MSPSAETPAASTSPGAAGASGSLPRVVVFDLGGVVVDWDPVPAIAAAVGRERAERLVSGADFDWAAWNHAQDAGRTWEQAESAAIASHPHLREEILAYRPNFAASIRGLVPGTAAVMRDLHADGIRLVALTNWSSELFPYAPQAFPEVFALFDDVVVSGDEGVAKPDPQIFAILARRLGTPLDGIPFIDDVEHNVAAARSAGLDAIRFTGAGDLRQALQDRGLLPATG